MDDFVVGQRQHEVFGEGVNHAEREVVLMICRDGSVAVHIAQRIVHPAHVPLHAESQAAGVNGMRHAAPRGRFFGDRDYAGELAVHVGVEIPEELDGLQVFAAAVFIGNPFASLRE